MEFVKADNPDDLIKMAAKNRNTTDHQYQTKKLIEENLKTWILCLRKEHPNLSAKSIRKYVYPIIAFYILNDVVEQINTKKLWRFLPQNHRPIEDRAYTVEEIAKLLEAADERTRVIILLLASTGMRIGALADLTISDLEPIEDFYKIRVYAGFDEQYFTYCTPECRSAIDSYIDFRKRLGEKNITAASPLFREDFDIQDKKNAANPRKISRDAIIKSMWLHAYRNGIRTPQTHGRGSGKRTELYLNHGLRKFFNTQLIKARIRPQIKELLMGHNIKGIQLDNSYYKPTLDEMIEEYKTAIPILTINEENRLKLKLKEEKEDHQKQLEKITVEIDSIKQAMARVMAAGEVKPL